MALVHKSVYIRPEVWQVLRINAALSDCPVRDYLTYLIEGSAPVGKDEDANRAGLDRAVEANAVAASIFHSSSAPEGNITSESESGIRSR